MPEFYLVAGFDGEECARKCNLTIKKRIFLEKEVSSSIESRFEYFQFLLACGCNGIGSSSMQCDGTGSCPCNYPYTGPACASCQCSEGETLVSGFPNCVCEGK